MANTAILNCPTTSKSAFLTRPNQKRQLQHAPCLPACIFRTQGLYFPPIPLVPSVPLVKTPSSLAFSIKPSLLHFRFRTRGEHSIPHARAATIASSFAVAAVRGSRKRPRERERESTHLPTRRQIRMDALDKENQPPQPSATSLDALLAQLPLPGATFRTPGGHCAPLLYMGESARKIFMLEQPDERRVRLVLAVAAQPASVGPWLALLRCPVAGCGSRYNRSRLVRRALTCMSVEANREDAGYAEMWIMLAKLNESEMDTRKTFAMMKKQRVGEKHALLYEEEAAFEYRAGKGGNKEVAEEVLERGVDNDALTPAQKEELLKRVVAGTVGWVSAFSGEPREQKSLALPRKTPALQDHKGLSDRKALGDLKVQTEFGAQENRKKLDTHWKLEMRKALSDLEVVKEPKTLENRVTQENPRPQDDSKSVTTPRGQFHHPLMSPRPPTTPADTTPLSHTRVGPSASGFATARKMPRNDVKSPLLTTPSLPTRASVKSQSTSRKAYHPPSRLRTLGGPPLRVIASSKPNDDSDSDSDDDDDVMMAESPKKPSKPLTPVKETPSALSVIKSETKPRKKVDIDISHIMTWKPKFRGDSKDSKAFDDAPLKKPTVAGVDSTGLVPQMSPSSARVAQPPRPASVNSRLSRILEHNASPVAQRVPESSSVASAATPANALAHSNKSRAPDHYRSPKRQQLDQGAVLAKNHADTSPYSPSSASSSSSPPLASTISSTSQDTFASLASRVVVGGLQYIKLEQIGSGGSSKVYRMLGPDLKIYALKKIKLKKLDEQSIAQYTNEINLLRKLQGNKHIIKLIAAEQDIQQRQINVIMEHGEIDLSERLRDLQGGMDENFLRVIWTQMLQAVDAIHSERIIHGDLKPANFLFVNGALKLIDFGIAKAISNDTTNIERDSQIGTVNFMSPEAIQGNTMPNGQRDPEGKMKVGRASDIWSLGCILYQIVYSKPPFADVHNIIEKFRCIIDPSIPIPFPPLKNKDLENVIRSCLQREHRRRPTITGENGLLNHPFLRSGTSGGVSTTTAVTMVNAPQVLTQLGDLLRSQGVASSRVNMFMSIGQEGLRNASGETPRHLYNTQERRTEI